MSDSISFSFHKLFPEKLLLTACSLLFLIYGILPPQNKLVALWKRNFSMGYQWHQGKRSLSYLYLRKKNHCSLVKSSTGSSGGVEAVISECSVYYSLHESLSNQRLKRKCIEKTVEVLIPLSCSFCHVFRFDWEKRCASSSPLILYCKASGAHPMLLNSPCKPFKDVIDA